MFIWFTNNIPSLLSQNQEITNHAVAASKLLRPLCSIIDAVCMQSRKKNSFTTKITKEHEGIKKYFIIILVFLRESLCPSWFKLKNKSFDAVP
jgi:hypothetical protein